MTERLGDWMQTVTGKVFWPIDPRPEEVYIEDIAHALGMMCRYNGHCTKFYSVAEHSWIVSQHVPQDYALWGLLHDASEAYIADIVRPAKRFISGYIEAEDKIMAAVCDRFGLTKIMPPEVKKIDSAILVDEAKFIMGPKPMEWDFPEPAIGLTNIAGWSPEVAKQKFLERFYELVSI